MAASRQGHTETVKLLLEKGANAEIKSLESKTAYDYAKSEGIKILLTAYMKK
jgi:ankyrin repeat protein